MKAIAFEAMRAFIAVALASVVFSQGVALAQAGPGAAGAQQPSANTSHAAPGKAAPADSGYTIGPDDVLGILFWRDAEMSGDVIVRPDGMITLPILRDVKAAGFTPDQLAESIQHAAREFITDASVTVVVRQMNSRKAFITGEVARPGAYPLAAQTTVMQLIALAGGLTEFAKAGDISILRVEGGRTTTLPFDYDKVAAGKKPAQNISLKPGDTVVVPER